MRKGPECQGEESPTNAEESKERIEDIDTARAVAESESSIRDRMKFLIEMGVPKEDVQVSFKGEIESASEDAKRSYEHKKRSADMLMLYAVQNKNKVSSISSQDVAFLEKIWNIIEQRQASIPDSKYVFLRSIETRENDFVLKVTFGDRVTATPVERELD